MILAPWDAIGSDDGIHFGNEFRILTTEPSYSAHGEVFSNSGSNNEIDVAVHKRNMQTEAELGITIKQFYITDPAKTLLNNELAEINTADLVIMELSGGFSEIIASDASVFLDLSEQTTLDLSAPWYNHDCTEDLSIKGHVYAVTGAGLFSSVDSVYVIAYDKEAERQLLVSGALDMPLSKIAQNGNWTLSLLGKLARNSLSLGYAQTELGDNAAFALCVGAGAKSFTKSEEDVPYITATSFDFAQLCREIFDLNAALDMPLEIPQKFPDDPETPMLSEEEFIANSSNSAFKVMTLGEYMTCDDSRHGLLPMPKRNNIQESYISPVDMSRSRAAGVLSSSRDTELALRVLDTLFEISQETVVSAYFTSISAKDENFAFLSDHITGVQAFDIGDMFGWGDISGAVGEITSSDSFTSFEKIISERAAVSEFSMSVILGRLPDKPDKKD